MTFTSYDPARDIRPAFITTVSSWILTEGEVFVIFRYLAAAGAKEYAFYDSSEAFLSACQRAPSGTDIVVFKDRQLPLRGIVDDAFALRAKSLVSRNTEYLIVDLQRGDYDIVGSSGWMGQGHEELVRDLADLRGHSAAFGALPDFGVDDHETMISAAKDGIDGPR